MSASDESFLPQIVGVFYATFDPTLGPIVQHQVPENLITSSKAITTETSRSRSRSKSRSNSRSRSVDRQSSLSTSLSSLSNGVGVGRRGTPSSRTTSNSPKRSNGGGALLDFTPISEYVIPKKSLHGKLVALLTTGYTNDHDDDSDDEDRQRGRGRRRRRGKVEYRVMGFPNVLSGEGGRYKRNEYMWNLCFVFKASSSLEAFEPVVRKCARILRSAERDSSYLSTPSPEHTSLPAVLEQLFEDLNSYSETSIPLDGFNSLELKLFPFYPNPPECEEWHVPIALVDLNGLKDDNWDITAARISQYIDGINHVKRIADLADADVMLTRETLKHMLFYQVIMTIDIFQYSNMYTLKPSISRLASDETIINECGVYVTRRGFLPADWPVLLRLYSKLIPGLTIHEWIEVNQVLSLGIDPRRFVSFGIIKGFLRRVHRWPKLLERGSSPLFPIHNEHRRRVGFDDSAHGGGGGGGGGRISSTTTLSADNNHTQRSRIESSLSLNRAGGGGGGESAFTLRSVGSNNSLGLGVSPSSTSISIPARTPPSISTSTTGTGRRITPSHRNDSNITTNTINTYGRSLASGGDSHSNPSHSSRKYAGPNGTNGNGGGGGGGGVRYTLTARQKEEMVNQRIQEEKEEELIAFLDGNHHTDEIQVRFGMGWKNLESILGLDDLKYGKGKKGITVVYR